MNECRKLRPGVRMKVEYYSPKDNFKMTIDGKNEISNSMKAYAVVNQLQAAAYFKTAQNLSELIWTSPYIADEIEYYMSVAKNCYQKARQQMGIES